MGYGTMILKAKSASGSNYIIIAKYKKGLTGKITFLEFWWDKCLSDEPPKYQEATTTGPINTSIPKYFTEEVGGLTSISGRRRSRTSKIVGIEIISDW